MTKAAEQASTKASPNGTAQFKVLIVDDDAGVRNPLSDILSKAGFRVDSAANGMHAMTKLNTGSLPDLILLDLMMPGMNGHEMMKVIRADERFRNIPVMMMT